MTNTFTLFDIPNLMRSFGNSSISNDCLPNFLSSYTFDCIYETEDNSLVFEAGGKNDISLEFFNFNNPLTREIMIMYKEDGKFNILYHEDLMKIA